MNGKNILYMILGIILVVLLGPTVLAIFGTVISFIFAIVGIVILVAVLGFLYLKHKAKKQFENLNESYDQYNRKNSNSERTYNTTEYKTEDKESVIIDVDYEDVDNSK